MRLTPKYQRPGLGISVLQRKTSTGTAGPVLTDAIVFDLAGQSLNSSRDTNVLASSWSEAYMPVDGCTVSQFTYFSGSNLRTPNWASLASVVPLDEGTSQSPIVGIATTIAAGPYARGYFCSSAIPGANFAVINQGGPLATTTAVVHRLCALARADGFNPKVVYYIAEGEEDGDLGTSQALVLSLGSEYVKALQLIAKQAMRDPDYLAPVIMTYPPQMLNGDADRNVKAAIREICETVPGVIDGGPAYQWPMLDGNIHPTPEAYVMRGEFIGKLVLDPVDALHITSVTLSGDEFVATFSENVVRDATLGIGANLDGTDGFEWLDNGTPIAITNLVYSGATVTGTLASTPVGTLAQQVLRIAEQLTSALGGTDPGDVAGSYVRVDAAGWASTFDPTYTNYRWAIPQRISSTDLVSVEAA